MPIPHAEIQRHFRRADPVVHRVIRQVGPFTLKPNRNRFGMLVGSIISQQLSTKAARTIRGRLEELVQPLPMTAESIAKLSKQQLRSAGLSNNKADYVLDLTAKVLEGDVRLKAMGRKTDEEVIEDLTRVHGIGRWTAQMFLIFSLGRLDVFPYDDLGVRMAIKNLYGLAEPPNKAVAQRIAAPWKPFSSVASWYCWRSLDL